MPLPLDLTGRRFGRLVVLRREGYVQFGRRVAAWLCRCDCGREEAIPQLRLPYAEYIARARHSVEACSHCRLSSTCVVCGSPFVAPGGGGSTRATCERPECRDAHRKAKGRAAWRRRQERDPDLPKKMAEARKERLLSDEEYRTLVRAAERRRTLRRSERLRTDPEYAERERELSRAWYARNAERVQADRRERLDRMTVEQREDWLVRQRGYQREYAAGRREEIAAHPERHQEYLDNQREYRRQRALAELLSVGAELLKRAKDDHDD